MLNQIGQVMMAVTSGNLAAGPHAFDLDVAKLANGTYYFVVKTEAGVEETPFAVVH